MLVLGACAGARGIEPVPPGPAGTAPSSGATVVLGPIATPRLVLTTDPVAVPRTTTTVSVPSVPPGVDPSTTTTSTTTTVAAPPVPENRVSSIPAEGTVVLTFDDGPFDGWTDTILDALASRGVTATFFISTYRLPAIDHLIPEIVARGHSVQTHGNHHDDLTLKTEEEVRLDITTSIDKLVAAGAPKPTCFRPPYGMTSETVNGVAAELGLEVIGWSLNSLDYSLQDDRVIDTILNNVRPGDNVLMHDQWAPVWETALPVVIDGIIARGIGFSTICGPPPAG